MVDNPGQFADDNPDIIYLFRNFNPHHILDSHRPADIVHGAGNIVQPVRQHQNLLVAHPFGKFFQSAVNIADSGFVGNYAFAVDFHNILQNPVHRRMRRTKIKYNLFVFFGLYFCFNHIYK